jgi:hypothetical protein
MLALDRHEAGARYHAVAEDGVPLREIAEAVRSGLRIPIRSLTPGRRLTSGASASDAAAWARDAMNLARDAGRAVTVADVLAVAAPPDARPPDALRRVAVHQAAHAIVALALGSRVAAVTGVETGDTGGST